MKIIRDLPEIYCELIENRLYKPNPNHLSVTDLINPPLIKHLKIKYWDNDRLEVKASEFLWMIMGIAGHKVFEESGLAKRVTDCINRIITGNYSLGEALKEIKTVVLNQPTEKKLEIEVNGTKIKGRLDFREFGVIRDFKFTSVWSFVHGVKEEWIKQLNVYAFMCKKLGLPVNKLIVEAILRDWSLPKTYRDNNYPKIPFVSFDITLWDIKDQYDYIADRVNVYKQPPKECTPEEKWQKNTTYAVKKPKTKRAVRVFDTEDEANQYIKDHPDKTYELEVRPGECTRCKLYCPVRKVCPFNKYIKG